MRFADIPAGAPITLRHLHPSMPLLRFEAPRAPRLTWRFDDALSLAAPRLHHMVIEPDALRVSCTWATDIALPRSVIPGIHAHIPLALQVGDEWCPYEAPKTVVASLREAGLDPISLFRA